MPKTNINKFAAFVILAYACVGMSGCSVFSSRGTLDVVGPYKPHEVYGKLESPDLKEASGIAASKCQPDVFWTHNDSGDKALIYAIDSKGKHIGVWSVSGATNRDWEDIATVKTDGKCYVLIGEIGDNDHKYKRLAVFRVEEPVISESARASTAKEPLQTAEISATYIMYPNEKHDAEALLAHPSSGDIYLLTKSSRSPSHVYKFKPTFQGDEQTMQKVAEITVPAIPNGSITGGDISPDGKRVILCDYFSGYELELPDGAGFDSIWKQRPVRVDLGEREIGEAVAYSADGSFVIAVSEKRNTSVNIARRKN
jgi:hypothetical protein